MNCESLENTNRIESSKLAFVESMEKTNRVLKPEKLQQLLELMDVHRTKSGKNVVDSLCQLRKMIPPDIVIKIISSTIFFQRHIPG